MPAEWKTTILFFAGLAAGVMNSIAGGGTLITFPALLWAGLPSISANATNTWAVMGGISTSIWSYRNELASQRQWVLRYAGPSLLGGLVGSLLLLRTGETVFNEMIPYLLLFAALVFTFQNQLMRLFEIEAHAIEKSRYGLALAMFVQFLVASYGGYFGAGIGILMLAALGLMGQKNIHAMNALKVFQGLLINGIACVVFVLLADIYWVECGTIFAGTALGGILGPRLARRVGPKLVRAIVSVIGFGIAFYFLVK
ncbi:MAG: sulfite exporter TauE/SafE family protein [Acidobacteria bacterium]|nr:sulfite exporter TauE/SafE family protein [Acidobacteriota bacterium]